MRQALKLRLKTWQNETHAGETKRVFVTPSPALDGEFVIRLEKAMHESLGNKKAHLVVSQQYLTTAQANLLKDPSIDLHQLNFIIESLDKEFQNKYDQAINDAFVEEVIRFANAG
jgi:hypothetical protein